MVTTHTMVSISIRPTLSIHLKHTRTYHLLKVWAIVKQCEPIEISVSFWRLSEAKPELKSNEFVVTSTNELRLLIEQIRKEGLFTDTGKRVQFNTNLWGEVWKLKPEHLTLLQEKETRDEQATSEHQSKHRPKVE